MLSGTNVEHARPHNRRVVLETIRLYEPISRAEIARHTHLTSQTVSNIVVELLSEGVVLTRGRRTGGKGQPALELELNPNGGYTVGLHLDQDHVSAVLCNLKGSPIHISQHLERFDTPEAAIPFLVKLVRDLLEGHGIRHEQVWGIGLALPGPIYDVEGYEATPSTPERWTRGWVHTLLARELEFPIWVENDGTAAAIGEHWYASSAVSHNFLYVFFGLGMGGGLMLDGQPLRGHLGNSLELGHVQVDFQGPACICGGQGCVELYASPRSLQAALAQQGLPLLRPEELVDAHTRASSWLIDWLEGAAAPLAAAVVSWENMLEPEAIVFGGRFPPELIADLVARVEPLVAARRMRAKPYLPRLLVAQVGNHAAALGAATLPIHDALAPNKVLMMKLESSGKTLSNQASALSLERR